MRDFADLHTHSTASDGTLRPENVIGLAESKRLAAVALTDHDTMDGLATAKLAADRFPRLRFIPGIEISAKFPTGTLHVLGLGVDPSAPTLRRTLAELRAARDRRNPKIIAILRQIGLDITMADVLAVAKELRCGQKGKVIGRLHIAEALRRKRCVKTIDEAFWNYIGDTGPAFVDKECLTPGQAIAAIRDAGGLAVLAHPAQLKCRNRAHLRRIVRELIGAGLEGIEVHHPDHTATQTRLYLDLARQYKLYITGGSDFHGAIKPKVALGSSRFRLPKNVADRLLSDAGGRPR